MRFLNRDMSAFICSFWVSVSALFLTLFGFLRRAIFRNYKDDDSQTNSLNSHEILLREKISCIDLMPSMSEALLDNQNTEVSKAIETESNNFIFKFQFQTYEEFMGKNRDDLHHGFSSENDFINQFSEKSCLEKIPEDPPRNLCIEEATFPPENLFSEQEQIEKFEDLSTKMVEKNEEDKILLENDSLDSDTDTDSITSIHDFWSPNQFVHSNSDDFLSVHDFESSNEVNRGMSEENSDIEDMNSHDSHLGCESDDFDEEEEEVAEQEQSMNQTEGNPVNAVKNKMKEEELEEGNGLETLWEHQELLEQLKMELKKVRATGLPTIFEESEESPKITGDLKPWKIDEKFDHADFMDELRKFYKSYAERMRKFDILNYQKMYSIGFMQSKDPLKSISTSSKALAPAITSILSQSFWLCRPKKGDIINEPMKKFTKELHGDLEMIYVGQMCLSWDFIQWQYEKAIDLWESDPYSLHRYNEVAGEFQQFQVLMQRFMENEAFEGPRVENYVKNRCISHDLLQVPVIREDKLREKKKMRKVVDDEEVTNDVLIEILQESIRMIWKFIRADKDANNAVLKCQRGSRAELLNPADSKLLVEVRADLLKKERKLRDILRSGNCILRRLKRNIEAEEESENTDHDLYFFSQVDMKLVLRVLNMSRLTTDQLVWCRNKLSRIRFISRKIRLEPSFFLFPC